MADIERIERELREGLVGVTKGPWEIDATITVNGKIERAGVYWLPHADDPSEDDLICKAAYRNAAHIARCSPDTIRALLDELARRAEIIGRAKEVIRPYADVANFYDHDPDDRDSEEMGDDQLAFMHRFKLGRLRSARTFLASLEPTYAE